MAAVKRVVVVGDDFGVNPYRTRGIADALRSGAVTAVAAVPNGECTAAAIRSAAAEGLLSPLSTGLHFNISEGVPCCRPADVRSLVGEDGRFLGKVGVRERLVRGQLRLADVERELTKQVEVFRGMLRAAFGPDAGGPVHADGHHHLGVAPGVVEVFVRVLRAAGIRSTRIPFDEAVYCGATEAERARASAPLDPDAVGADMFGRPFWVRVCVEASAAARLYAQAGIRFAGHYTGLDLMGPRCSDAGAADALHRYARGDGSCVRGGDPNLLEVMTHVGYTAPADCSPPSHDPFHYCAFSREQGRERELSVWRSDLVVAARSRLQPTGFTPAKRSAL
eukprot:TRINITY_DN22131_c0_g1_i1.p1 TRINITY_DN22131_c0_g1~~TRINITY_DN22131_c0_g1_i1.p1  ORF type:complete len:355 (+),score=103.89 TRINITY_DN22131_c0_g1_i1:59-1066(+)